MGLDLKKVHETEQIKGTTESRLIRVHPTASLGRQGEPSIWIQDGGIYYESGELVKEVPAWFWEDARKITPERRRQLGLRLPEEPRSKSPAPTAAEAPASVSPKSRPRRRRPAADKTCPACGKAGLKNLGAHRQHCPKKEGG